MDIEISKSDMRIEKELNALDRFVTDFIAYLDKTGIKYVIVSGYTAILFGRSRSSEDIDIIIENINHDQFRELWDLLNFECINTKNPETAYHEYLLQNNAIRFARKNHFIPNMELKFPTNELDKWTIENRKRVLLNNHTLFISPLELQIPFKLHLGSEKDIEDAKYLYQIFKGKINMEILHEFNQKLKVEESFNRYLR